MNDHVKFTASNVRIILFGSEGGFSRSVLEQLLAYDLNVTGVVIVEPLPDTNNFPVAVKQAAKRGSLEEMATTHKVEIIRTQNLNDDAFIKQLAEKQGDIFLLACFSKKIPARIWQKMKPPCWNLHPSLLPGYRGPNPLYWQIKNSEPDTGLTLHEVTNYIDGGNIVARKSLPLPGNHDKNSLDTWVSEQGVNLFHNALIQYLQGKLEAKPQDEKMASYFPAPKRGTSADKINTE